MPFEFYIPSFLSITSLCLGKARVKTGFNNWSTGIAIYTILVSNSLIDNELGSTFFLDIPPILDRYMDSNRVARISNSLDEVNIIHELNNRSQILSIKLNFFLRLKFILY